MPVDLQSLGSKLRRYREQLQLSLDEISKSTGITSQALKTFEEGTSAPSGDEILILADFYKCDYRFFISNERLAPFEQTDILYRRHGKEFPKQDRLRIQEFLFLCECEAFLMDELHKPRNSFPPFTKQGQFFKGQAEKAASAVRSHLKYQSQEVRMDVYDDFRKLGFHVFRRELGNSNISGLCIRHPVAGTCLLVNYSEDVYRQRFSVAHEAAHAILDDDQEVIVSFVGWKQGDLVEIRANAFASRFLMPPEFLRQIPEATVWSESKAIEWANKLKVSTEALSIALLEAGLISSAMQRQIKALRIAQNQKADPELPAMLAERSRERKESLLRRGLSTHYVRLCFEAYERGIVSAARVAEMLLVDESELREIASLFGAQLVYVS